MIGSAASVEPSGIEYLRRYIFSKSILESAFLDTVVTGVSGDSKRALFVIDVDNPLPVFTLIYHPPAVSSYCIGCPSSPGFLSATDDTMVNLPPMLLIPLIALAFMAAFLLVANLS